MTIFLLILALIVPVIGAVALRVLAARLSALQVYGAATLIFGVAIASVLVLARSEVRSVQVGGLTLLLPSAPFIGDVDFSQITVVPAPDDATTVPADTSPVASPTAAPTVTPTTEPTALPSAVPTVAPTELPTAAPTAVPTIEPTVVPTALPPTAAPVARPSIYTMQRGDTLRSVAQQFNVSVADILRVNNWTAAQGDRLPVGQQIKLP